MKNLKKEILIIILFMTIGIAAVTSNIVLSGSTTISNNPDDFLVYFSNYIDHGENPDLNYTDSNVIVSSKNKITFTGTLKNLGETLAIDVDITNASKNYDANINLSCNTNSEYIDVVFGTTDNTILARGSINAGFEAKLIKSYTGEEEIKAEITCTFTATPVEKTTISNDTVQEPLSRTYFVGEEITIGTEKFNIISDNGSTISMLAQYNLGTDYRQTSTENLIEFSGGASHSELGPRDIDIQIHSTNPKTYVNQYVSYLTEISGDLNLKGDLISVKELKKLGFLNIDDEYYYKGGETCVGTPYSNFLINGQSYWTKTTTSTGESYWIVTNTGEFSQGMCKKNYFGIRPVITISKSAIPKEIINFQINSQIYQAEKGMTWEAWVESEYNTLNFYISNNQVISQHGAALQSKIIIDTTSTSFSTSMNDIIDSSIIYKYNKAPTYGGGGND